MAVNAKELLYEDDWPRVERDVFQSDDENPRELVSTYSCYHKYFKENRLRKYFRVSPSNETLDQNSEAYSAIWMALSDNGDDCSCPFGKAIHTYHFRFADVSRDLSEGGIYVGPIRIGVKRSLETDFVSASKLSVVVYDDGLKPLAEVEAQDWSASQLRAHIGDHARKALLFCSRDGRYDAVYLNLAVSWDSDIPEDSSRKPWRRSRGNFYYSAVFVPVSAPEAISDVAYGEPFEALPKYASSNVELTRVGFDYSFATLPSEFGEALEDLAASGYQDIVILCIQRGAVVNCSGEQRHEIEIRAKYSPRAMRELARFRRASGLDVRFDGNYERLFLDPVERPYDIPFGDISVEWVATPLPQRKNPLMELKVDGTVVRSLRFRQDGYDAAREHDGMKSIWARMHYDDDEEDRPYLDIIWDCGKEGTEQ